MGRSTTAPIWQRGKSEARRGREICQVSRQIRARASPQSQQSVLSTAQGQGQVGGNPLREDFSGFLGGNDVVSKLSTSPGRRNQQSYIMYNSPVTFPNLFENYSLPFL